jgi:hypothetical protein
MNRLFFDLFHSDIVSRDEDGTCFETLHAAQQSAIQSLLEIAKSKKLSNEATELMYSVRDAADRHAFTARLLILVTP